MSVIINIFLGEKYSKKKLFLYLANHQLNLKKVHEESASLHSVGHTNEFDNLSQ